MPLGGAETDDLFDVRQEPHVEHPVNLVEDQMSEVRQVNFALVHEIEQTARSGHEDVDAALDLLPLMSIAHATVDQPDPETGMFG